MKIYVDKNALQDYTTKLIAKEKTIFATKDQVGSPLVASTVAGMTDHDKVYVYVGSETGYTSGNWYYWDGSAWVSGGIYNSEGFVLDDTLTSATLPAQAKAVGDAVGELSEDIDDLTSAFDAAVGEVVPWQVGTQGKYQPYESGATATNNLYDVTDFVDISAYKYIRYATLCSTAASTKVGIAFFSETDYHSYISGVQGYSNADAIAYKEQMAEVPDGAVYARFTLMSGDTNGFFIEGYKNVEEAFLYTLKQGGMYPSSYVTEWLQGGINTSTGAAITSSTKCRSAGFLHGRDMTQNGKVVFKVKDGYNLTCVAYNYPPASTSGSADAYAETSFVEKTGTFVFDISPELYYRFVVGNTASEDMEPSDVPDDAIKYTGVQWTDKTLSVYGAPADSSISGEILSDIVSAIGNYAYYPNYTGLLNTGGLTQQGADAAVAHRARTTYITIVPGTYYYIDLGSADYTMYGAFTYSSMSQSAVIRRLPIINGRYIFFRAGATETRLRMAIYYTADKDGHDFTSEEVATIKTLITFKTVVMPNTKLERTGDVEYFSVTVDRPMSFGGSDLITEQQEIECMLKLPSAYRSTGTPTRLILACHGAEGYIDSANDHWGGTGWAALVNALIDAGYAVFDCNVLPTSTGISQMGFCVGSPLAVNVAKKAYDYIQQNYNVHREIFVHGTSMGGTLASAFTNAYPNLVLAESSLAGRDTALYFYRIENGTYSDASGSDGVKFALSWGYETIAALKADHWSHIDGMAQVLTLHKYVDGVLQYPPDRETEFDAWMAYYSDVQKYGKNDAIGDYTARRIVPYKTWESWGDNVYDTKAKLILQKAYNAAGCLYEVVVYENYDHDDMGFGKVENLRDQLIAWFKRWE